ncbi:hypothetical protein PAHAL_7G094000 [Panicum hallii]|uniref:Uncharacterized protein n=1 Tax=Panicum hallii TaxID=206008 RepID=A0A2T8IBP4_9POAL|nr:hypothetical protein PAHAL_7G094000 [Panicum hallii]
MPPPRRNPPELSPLPSTPRSPLPSMSSHLLRAVAVTSSSSEPVLQIEPEMLSSPLPSPPTSPHPQYRPRRIPSSPNNSGLPGPCGHLLHAGLPGAHPPDPSPADEQVHDPNALRQARPPQAPRTSAR